MMNKCPGQTYSDFVTQNYCQEEIDILDDISPTILLKNGTIVNADSKYEADILIKDGIIAEIRPNIKTTEDVECLDVLKCYVMPGGIDPHTHLDFEFMGTNTVDDFYTGTKAAVAGGTTMIIDFIIPKTGESLINAYERYIKKSKGIAVCDFAFHMAITYWNDNVALEMKKIVYDYKINSFKMFMAYKDMFMLNDAELYQSFLTCKNLGALPMVHAENGSVIQENSKLIIKKGITGPEGHDLSRPEDLEHEATNRACVIAGQTDSPLYVVHVMTDGAAKIINEHQINGKRIFGETLAAAIGSDGAPIGCSYRIGAAHVMSPPISHNPNNKLKILQHLVDGTLECTGSDNCTFTCEQKEKFGKDCFTQIPNGVNGVEDRMSVIWQKGVRTGKLSLNQFVAVTSTNAAKIFNLYPKKGSISVGSDADIVIWDPDIIRTISSKNHTQACDFNIFEGMEIKGAPRYVLVKGMLCKDNDQLKVVKGFGEYVPTYHFSKYVYPNAQNVKK